LIVFKILVKKGPDLGVSPNKYEVLVIIIFEEEFQNRGDYLIEIEYDRSQD